MIGIWVVIGEIECAVAVAQWYTGKIPENQHEAPFFVVHVPIEGKGQLIGFNEVRPALRMEITPDGSKDLPRSNDQLFSF